MKIFIADDATLMREGLAGILQRVGFEVVGFAEDAPSAVSRVGALLDAGEQVDVFLTDVRMPPGMSDDGLRAAAQLRERYPQLAIMVLSQYVAPAYAASLFVSPDRGKAGIGYLLKERVSKVSDFVASLNMVAAGGMVVDPDVAAGLIRGSMNALSQLTPREREVLELMARGMSNSEIQDTLFLSSAAVSKHVSNIFTKLGLPPGEENRRVRAVLAYLTATGQN
ncbi:DNA-binding NarL/FixJ family response regulator [Arcanobacterium wilhelmae]|uniref:DNA-binding NarL/FixJ family response regulator n=1 Tax=Arcanobacterium wilhelmae TaxID=1803177 RepID=A0ABT9NE59_9ACTO|nr:response regulator transcription factor [Arcanobacterium wilhelmae]MDP9801661.1 DNA-binding NarL/FixJ family response regulator [Arcanobacterium wilhelmae]WFN90982.1 response regulator transcription factor [Arcanobacterium wilhelmae]